MANNETRDTPTLVDVRQIEESSGSLIRSNIGVPETLDAYVAEGGYQPLPDATKIRELAGKAVLRGAGGAGFPMATKLEAVASADGPRVAIGNGEEGEPASVKDRWLLRNRPHLVLDGLRAAVAAVEASRAVLFLSDATSVDVIRKALAEGGPAQENIEIEIVLVAPTYVAGEETSVVRAVEGGEAKPLPKPPRPYQKGVDGQPTLVSNVETLARLAIAVRDGNVDNATATVLATVIFGDQAVLLEAPPTFTLAELLAQHPDPLASAPKAVLLGGFAGGIWGPEILTATLSHDELRARGALWGCGSVIAIGEDECVVDVALDVAKYFEDSSSQQCGACVRGTQVVFENLTRISRGQPREDDFAKLELRAASMIGRGNCAMPDADSALIISLMANFAETIQEHLVSGCPICTAERPARSHSYTRFRVQLDAYASTLIAQEA